MSVRQLGKALAVYAKAIREAVFIQEQHIAAEDEWDAEGCESAVHFIVFRQDQAIATARLLSNQQYWSGCSPSNNTRFRCWSALDAGRD